VKSCLKYIINSIIFSVLIIQGKEYNNIDTVDVNSPEYTVKTQIRALFVKPSTNNLYYAAEAFPFNTALTTPILSPRWEIFDLHPDYHAGFDIGLQVTCHSRGSNIGLNWERFASSTCATHIVAINDMIGPLSSIGPDAAKYTHGRGNVHFTFNEVNARYGVYMSIGMDLQTNLFAGISFAKIKQSLVTLYSDGTTVISRTTSVPSSFAGTGPQCGVDFTYNIAGGFNFTGQCTAALLMGKVKNHTSYASTSPDLEKAGNPSPNLQGTSSDKRTQMVPSFGQRLGFVYSSSFSEHFMTMIEVGYEAKILLNVIQSDDMSSGVINLTPELSTVGVFARTFHRTLGNFSFGGPYLAFNIAF